MINFKIVSVETTLIAAIMLFLSGFFVGGVRAESVDCSICHPDLAKKKVIHAAVSMGCETCHASLNAAEMPHKVTGKVPKGLSSGQPDICFGCHDKAMFIKKNVHAALQMGCTTCHNPHSTNSPKLLVADMPGLCFTCHDKTKFGNKTTHAPVMGGMCTSCHSPHSSDNAKLLLSEAPDLCFNCHDKTQFSKKNVHAPVAGGMCLSCHGPHATEEMALLTKRPMAVCLDCHPDIPKKTHVTVEYKHPLGSTVKPVDKNQEKKPAKKERGIIMDPARPGKEFYCGSCHDPHSSEGNRLIRYRVESYFDLCLNCHKK
jgi:predicted CXXCH cytochrome family protein